MTAHRTPGGKRGRSRNGSFFVEEEWTWPDCLGGCSGGSGHRSSAVPPWSPRPGAPPGWRARTSCSFPWRSSPFCYIPCGRWSCAPILPRLSWSPGRICIVPIGQLCRDAGLSKVRKVIVGGATRTHSVLAGLGELSSGAGVGGHPRRGPPPGQPGGAGDGDFPRRRVRRSRPGGAGEGHHKAGAGRSGGGHSGAFGALCRADTPGVPGGSRSRPPWSRPWRTGPP